MQRATTAHLTKQSVVFFSFEQSQVPMEWQHHDTLAGRTAAPLSPVATHCDPKPKLHATTGICPSLPHALVPGLLSAISRPHRARALSLSVECTTPRSLPVAPTPRRTTLARRANIDTGSSPLQADPHHTHATCPLRKCLFALWCSCKYNPRHARLLVRFIPDNDF